ncbi:hypothetical protein ACWXWB_04630 [Pantoea dispersa]|uniref:hypothetical protein n=1 Tax=Pantoea dispersa TaxID=59814 RepID=UPI002DB87AA0|nr:hypothetical protein [Pantoea dispersa]MEB5972558.1 hypothetical protein [Pantoea dispersa]
MMNRESLDASCASNHQPLLLLIRPSMHIDIACCSCCRAAQHAWHEDGLRGGIVSTDDLAGAASNELLSKTLKNLRYVMAAAPRQISRSSLLVCQKLSAITLESAIRFQPDMLPDVLREWIVMALQPQLKQQRISSQLLLCLLNPAPLITHYRYWRCARQQQVLACEPACKNTLITTRHLSNSRLEMLGNFRLLQEMVQQKMHLIAPLSLSVSLSWLDQQDLPALLLQLFSFTRPPVRLYLYIDEISDGRLTEQLLENMHELKQHGVCFVLNGEADCRHLQRLYLLCDGVRYQMQQLSEQEDVQKRLLQHQRENKFVQIAGISFAEQELKAYQSGGVQLLMSE